MMKEKDKEWNKEELQEGTDGSSNIINIAGNRESKNKGISKRVEEFCVKLFTLLEK